LIVGKSLKDGVVELVERKTLQKTAVNKDEVLQRLKELI
jgi:prolyl-tRNA synthetase